MPELSRKVRERRFWGVKMSGPIRTNLRAQGPVRRPPLEELGGVGVLPALVHVAA